MERKLIIANWKSNPATEKDALRIFRGIVAGVRKAKAEVVVCPPFVLLSALSHVAGRMSRVSLGAQDVFWEHGGAHTGAVSPEMLANLGVKWVIIGHSERRRLGETDLDICRKVRAAIAGGLQGILCVGEALSVRKKGISVAEQFVRKQLAQALACIPRRYPFPSERLVIAYEPVWAISTNRKAKPDTPENAALMIAYIKKVLRSRFYILPTVLYGGSVNTRDAKGFLAHPGIDGALVGGASLKPKDFTAIVRAVGSR